MEHIAIHYSFHGEIFFSVVGEVTGVEGRYKRRECCVAAVLRNRRLSGGKKEDIVLKSPSTVVFYCNFSFLAHLMSQGVPHSMVCVSSSHTA